MLSEVTVRLADGRSIQIDLDEVQPMPHERALDWLDKECARLRCGAPMGHGDKAFMLRKVQGVAAAARDVLLVDPSWARAFARAAVAALARPVVHIDLAPSAS